MVNMSNGILVRTIDRSMLESSLLLKIKELVVLVFHTTNEEDKQKIVGTNWLVNGDLERCKCNIAALHRKLHYGFVWCCKIWYLQDDTV